MADFSDLFDLETSPEFENLWEQIKIQVPSSSRPPCSENQTSTTEAKTEYAGTTSVPRTLLSSNGKPATVPLTETTIKTENVPQSDEATLTKQDRTVKTEIPFKRYTSAGPTSTTSCTYFPPHDENWPPAASSTTFANVEDSILTIFGKKNPNKYEALNRRITEPRVTASREFKVLKALQKRIVQDMQQSEIIINYLTDKYGDEPEKKRVKFS